MKIEIDVPEGYTVVLQKKPETRWFRAYRYKTRDGYSIGSYSTCRNESDKIACQRDVESSNSFIAWITPWTEYEI